MTHNPWGGWHHAMPPPPPTPPRSNKRWLVVLIVAGVVIVAAGVGVAAFAVSASNDDDPTPAQPTADVSFPTATTSTTTQPLLPGGPRPCYPDRPDLWRCFPPEITARGLSEAIEARQGWRCFRRGETDDRGFEVSRDVECGRMFTANGELITLDVDMETQREAPKRPLRSITVAAGATGANSKVARRRTARYMDEAFRLAVREVWPDGARRGEASAAFKQVSAKCDRLTTDDTPKAITPHGYQIGCTRPIEITVDDKISVSRTAIITVPRDL